MVIYMSINYNVKYLKYKQKYLKLKESIGGVTISDKAAQELGLVLKTWEEEKWNSDIGKQILRILGYKSLQALRGSLPGDLQGRIQSHPTLFTNEDI